MGACEGRHAPGIYQDIPLEVSVLTIYEACSSLIFMFKYSNSFETYRMCLQQYLDSIWIVFGCRGCWGWGGVGGVDPVTTDPRLTKLSTYMVIEVNT